MKRLLEHFKGPLIASTILVLPFLVLELVYRKSFNEEFPIVLFWILWLQPVIFLGACQAIFLAIRGKTSFNLAGFLARSAAAVISAWLWVSVLLDQLPCFLGVMNCD